MSQAGWRAWASAHRVDLLLFGLSLFAYALSSGSLLARQSQAPHFVWQADAFLHGQLHLTGRPPNLNDWVFEGGRWYVSFPPFPAVLMMPFVALAGLSFNDVAFTLPFAAANVALLYRLLRRIQEVEGGTRSEWDHAVLALVFGFGTLAWSCSIRGEVWFTAEVVGVTFTLLYLHAALRAKHPVLAGAALACGSLCRTPIAFSAVFFLLEAVASGGPVDRANLRAAIGDRERRKKILHCLALFAAPIAILAAPVLWMNQVRFGNPAEFGHSHLYTNRVNPDIRAHGLFSFHYLARNLRSAFLLLPKLDFQPFRLGYDPNGMSLLVTTPLRHHAAVRAAPLPAGASPPLAAPVDDGGGHGAAGVLLPEQWVAAVRLPLLAGLHALLDRAPGPFRPRPRRRVLVARRHRRGRERLGRRRVQPAVTFATPRRG